jgi:hypothetical protein
VGAGSACERRPIMIHHHLGAVGDIGERAEYFETKMLFMEPRFGQPALISRENGKLEPFPQSEPIPAG